MNYADAGVSLERADKAMAGIKGSVKSTFNKQVLGDLGSFGGLFSLAGMPEKEPVLVSSVDGVGTKLKIAFDTGVHDRPGRDIVNHCIDDILVQGARPLFFLDYVATGLLKDGVLEEIVRGMAESCKANDTVLIGGETAEMPGFYQEGEYDISGTIVGVADKSKVVTGENIKAGNVILGLGSDGLHTNGYSLARKALFEAGQRTVNDQPEGFDKTLGDVLGAPHRCYFKPLWPLIQAEDVLGMVHITGSGFQGNIPRILPKTLNVVIDRTAWEVPPIFKLIQEDGDVEKDEMYNTFNMGVGMLVFVEKEKAADLKKQLEAAGETVCYAGEVIEGQGTVVFKD